MRSVWILLAGLACAVAPLASAAELRNASFEQAGRAPDQAADWGRWGDWMNRETGWSPVRDGQCLIGYHHWQIEKEASSGLFQDVKGATAGHRYTFRVQAMRDAVPAGTYLADRVELRLESTVDGKQVVIASKSYRVRDIATDHWVPLEVSGTAANDTLRVLVIVYPSSKTPRDGAVKFDQAALVALP